MIDVYKHFVQGKNKQKNINQYGMRPKGFRGTFTATVLLQDLKRRMHQHCKHGQFLQFPHPSSQRILGFQQLPGPKTKSTFTQDGRSILYKV